MSCFINKLIKNHYYICFIISLNKSFKLWQILSFQIIIEMFILIITAYHELVLIYSWYRLIYSYLLKFGGGLDHHVREKVNMK